MGRRGLALTGLSVICATGLFAPGEAQGANDATLVACAKAARSGVAPSAACKSAWQSKEAAGLPTRPMFPVDPYTAPVNFFTHRSDQLVTGVFQAYDTTSVLRRVGGAGFQSQSLARLLAADPTHFGMTASAARLNGMRTNTGMHEMKVGAVSPASFAPHARDYGSADIARHCAEHVWKSFYDYSRFEDAAHACGNDTECIYRLAFDAGANGVARRELHDIVGNPLSSMQTVVAGRFPKNMFFAVAANFLRDQTASLAENWLAWASGAFLPGCNSYAPRLAGGSNVPYARFSFSDRRSTSPLAGAQRTSLVNQDMPKVEAILQKKLVYQIGPASFFSSLFRPDGTTSVAQYATEWDWAQALHEKQTIRSLNARTGRFETRPLSYAEMRGIEERTARLESLLASFEHAATLRRCGPPVPVTGQSPEDRIRGWMDDRINPVPIENIKRHGLDRMLTRMAIGASRGDLVSGTTVSTALRAGFQPAAYSQNYMTPFTLKPLPSSRVIAEVSRPIAEAIKVRIGSVTSPEVIGRPSFVKDSGSTMRTLRAPNPAAPVDVTAPLRDDSALRASGVLGSLTASEIANLAATTASVGAGYVPGAVALSRLDPQGRAYVDRVAGIQQQIVELLVDELERGDSGCLSENGYFCDWSRDLFAEHMLSQYQKERASLYDTCAQYTDPGWFGSTASDRSEQGVQNKINAEMQTTGQMLATMPRVVQGGVAKLGQEDGDDQWHGDKDWYAAGYAYSAGWSIRPTDFAPADPNRPTNKLPACIFEADAHASFTAGANVLERFLGDTCNALLAPGKVTRELRNKYNGDLPPGVDPNDLNAIDSAVSNLGTEFMDVLLPGLGTATRIACIVRRRMKNLVDVGFTVHAAEDASSYDAHVILADEELFSAPGTTAMQLVEDVPFDYKSPEAKATVHIAGVDVEFRGQAELQMGTTRELTARVVSDCSHTDPHPGVDATLHIEPFARARAWGSASVGIPGLHVGVRGEVQLIDTRLPLATGLFVAPDGNQSIKFTPHSSLSFSVTLVPGYVSVYGSIGEWPFELGPKEVERISWGGWHDAPVIWNWAPETKSVGMQLFFKDNWASFAARTH